MRLAYDNANDMKKERKKEKKGRLNFKVKEGMQHRGSPLNLDDNVRSHNNDIAKYQEHAPLLGEVEAVEGDEEHGHDQEREEADRAHEERRGEVEAERRAARGVDDVRPGQADAEQDVEHGPAEARGEAHDGREDGDGHVRDEVGKGVAHREYGQADNGVGEAKDEAKCLRKGDEREAG